MILDCTKLKASYFTFSILYETGKNGVAKKGFCFWSIRFYSAFYLVVLHKPNFQPG